MVLSFCRSTQADVANPYRHCSCAVPDHRYASRQPLPSCLGHREQLPWHYVVEPCVREHVARLERHRGCTVLILCEFFGGKGAGLVELAEVSGLLLTCLFRGAVRQ